MKSADPDRSKLPELPGAMPDGQPISTGSAAASVIRPDEEQWDEVLPFRCPPIGAIR